MLRLLFIICLPLTIVGCKQNPRINANTIDIVAEAEVCPYKKHVFELSSGDENKIGFPNNDETEIGPNSICINDDVIYFINPLFSKVEAFNIKTDSTYSSISFSGMNNSDYSWIPRLYDLAFYNNKLYVLNGSELIYVLNEKLEMVNSIKTNCIDKKEILKLLRDKLVIYCYRNGDLINIDLDDNVSYNETDEAFRLREIGQTYLGDNYEYINQGDSLYFSTRYGKILLKEEIQDITLRYYQCKNFGFNSEYFVHFAIKPSENKITFYSYCY